MTGHDSTSSWIDGPHVIDVTRLVVAADLRPPSIGIRLSPGNITTVPHERSHAILISGWPVELCNGHGSWAEALAAPRALARRLRRDRDRIERERLIVLAHAGKAVLRWLTDRPSTAWDRALVSPSRRVGVLRDSVHGFPGVRAALHDPTSFAVDGWPHPWRTYLGRDPRPTSGPEPVLMVDRGNGSCVQLLQLLTEPMPPDRRAVIASAATAWLAQNPATDADGIVTLLDRECVHQQARRVELAPMSPAIRQPALGWVRERLDQPPPRSMFVHHDMADGDNQVLRGSAHRWWEWGSATIDDPGDPGPRHRITDDPMPYDLFDRIMSGIRGAPQGPSPLGRAPSGDPADTRGALHRALIEQERYVQRARYRDAHVEDDAGRRLSLQEVMDEIDSLLSIDSSAETTHRWTPDPPATTDPQALDPLPVEPDWAARIRDRRKENPS